MSAPRFKFSLQRLLVLREKAEKEAAIQLAQAQRAEESARDAKSALDDRRAEARDAVLPQPGTARTVAELRQAALLVEHLDGTLIGAREAISAAERSVQEQVGELGDRVRDRRVLDRLRERQHDDWKVADDRTEREVMDGIARTRIRDRDMKAQASQRNGES